MVLTFVLPKVSRYPVGGYKMVFEYANRLCRKGHSVNIIYVNDGFMRKYRLPFFLRRCLALYYTVSEPRWFDLDKRIIKISCFNNDLNSEVFDTTDVVVATAAQTVKFVEGKFSCKKIYYIQGYEDWGLAEEELFATYKNSMIKISVANWLKDIVDEYSPSECSVIKNPIDNRIYRIIKNYYDRPDYSIAVLYNELPIKGFKYAYEAILQLKTIYPLLHVEMFGRKKYPGELPSWINYTENASQNRIVEIYNSSRIYLCASIEEGYGLTGLEAMACGCTLVSTRYKGVLEYSNDDCAVLVPIQDVSRLVEAVQSVFENEKLFESMRNNALKQISQFSWEKAVKDFELIIAEQRD